MLTDDEKETLRVMVAHCPKQAAENCGCHYVYECRDVLLLLAENERLTAELALLRKAIHDLHMEENA